MAAARAVEMADAQRKRADDELKKLTYDQQASAQLSRSALKRHR
jgi:hypothetical protein